MRLEHLYRIRFTYPEGWGVELDRGWQQHFYVAGGPCEGVMPGTDISNASLLVAAGNRSSGCANILDERTGMSGGWFVWGPTATRVDDTRSG